MKTTEEKLIQIYKGCDKIIDELTDSLHSSYERGQYDLAKEILDVIEEG